MQRLGLAFTPPDHEDGLRCHYDAGNYQMAVEAIIWRTYEQSLPSDALETTIQGHRAARYWVLKPTYHISYRYFSCSDVQDQLRGNPAVAVLLDDLLQPRSRLPVHQPAAGQRPRPYYKF